MLQNFNLVRQLHSKGYRVLKAAPGDRKEILRLMQDVFYKTDPSSIYSKVSENPHISSTVQEMSLESLDENLSYVAKEKEKDKTIIGKVNSYIGKLPVERTPSWMLPPPEEGMLSPMKTKQIVDVFLPPPGAAINGIRPAVLRPNYMETLMKKVKSKREKTLLELWRFVSTMPPNPEAFFKNEKEVFEIRYLVVDPAHRNRGIATALVNSSLKEAANQAYKFVRIDCTSHFTARIASAAGMDCIYEIYYQDYKSPSGEYVFQNIIFPHTKVVVYAGKSPS